jgi:cell wall-associated NlpC family hydrolase
MQNDAGLLGPERPWQTILYHMKMPPVLQAVCGCAAWLWLMQPASLSAAPRHGSKPAAVAEDDDSEQAAQPKSSPSPSSRRNARNRNKAAADSAEKTSSAATREKSDPKSDPTPTASGKKERAENSRYAPRKDPPAEETAPPTSATPARSSGGAAATSSIEPRELQEFDAQPEPVRKLIAAALDLTKRTLTYTYGSADPANGGMDCSGTIYYLLKAQGFDEVPRQANEQYTWVRKQARFYAVLSKKQDNVELTEMRPGDLLFWTGTYNVDREPPVTHCMIYLGKRKQDGKRLMFGASDGRPYNGERRNGVSVFDFKMPAARSGDKADAATVAAPERSPDFAGYGPIPGMAERNDAAARQASAKKP